MPGNEEKGELQESRIGEEDTGRRSCRGGSTKPVLLIILLIKKFIDYRQLQLLSQAALTTTNLMLIKLYHLISTRNFHQVDAVFSSICHQFKGLTYCRRLIETVIIILQAKYMTRKFEKSLLLLRISHNFCYPSYKELLYTETNAFYKRLPSAPFIAHLFKKRATFYNAELKSNQ